MLQNYVDTFSIKKQCLSICYLHKLLVVISYLFYKFLGLTILLPRFDVIVSTVHIHIFKLSVFIVLIQYQFIILILPLQFREEIESNI